jgi:TolB-like protein
LILVARYRGRDAALSRAKVLTDLLRREIDVAPDAATGALINEIRRGDFAPASAPLLLDSTAVLPVVVHKTSAPAVTATSPLPAPSRDETAAKPLFWRRQPLAAASARLAVLAIGLTIVLTSISGPKMSVPRNPAIVVLPFTGNRDEEPDHHALASVLTHDLIGYLSRFGNLRVMSDQTTDLYRNRHGDVTQFLTDVGAQYAIAGHIQAADGASRIDVQLVDTASRTNVWSDNLQRERGEPTLVADESARGMARMIAIQINRLSALRAGAKPASQLTTKELVARGYLVPPVQGKSRTTSGNESVVGPAITGGGVPETFQYRMTAPTWMPKTP